MRISRAVVTMMAAVAMFSCWGERMTVPAAGLVMCQVTYDQAGVVEMDNGVPGNHDRLVYVLLAGGIFVHKTMTFSSQPGGKLRDLVSPRRPIDGHRNETTIRDHRERY
jgi:hypothetical protein